MDDFLSRKIQPAKDHQCKQRLERLYGRMGDEKRHYRSRTEPRSGGLKSKIGNCGKQKINGCSHGPAACSFCNPNLIKSRIKSAEMRRIARGT